MQKQNVILMVSTFRHFFISLGLAVSNKNKNYHLVFIDQKHNDHRNPILNFISERVVPFKTVTCLPTRQTGIKKRRVRKRAFKELKLLVDRLQPVEISAGNDRRVEFQYAMYYARCVKKYLVTGGYLDDGAGSYLSFNEFRLKKVFTDRFFDTPIKKLSYGHWYDRPSWLGTSKWVDRVYLSAPALMHPSMVGKEVVELNPSWFNSDAAKAIYREILTYSGVTLEQTEIQTNSLIILPPISIIEKVYGSTVGFHEQLALIERHSKNVFIKYHPRDLNDPLDLGKKYKLLEPTIPVELYVVLFDFNEIVGDVSTALLSAKWLKPSSAVWYIETGSEYTDVYIPVFERLAIKPLNSQVS